MATSESVRDNLSLRRRLLLTALGLRPADLGVAADLPSNVITAYVLSGRRHLAPDEVGRATALFSRKARELFEEHDE